MDYKLILAFFLVGMLLYGCTGAAPPATTQTPSGAQTATTPQAPTDLTGMDWTALVALGAPVECNVEYKDATLGQGIEKATMYLKGNKFKEVVTTTEGGKSITTTIVSKNDGYIYLLYDSATMAGMTQGKISCDGLKVPTNSSGTSVGPTDNTAEIADTTVFEDENKISFDCKPAIFGDEIFAVSGNFCTLKEITTALIGDEDPCAQITDPATRAQCQQMMGG